MSKNAIKLFPYSISLFLVMTIEIVFAADQTNYSALNIESGWQRFDVGSVSEDGVFAYSPDINGDGYSDLVVTGLTSQTAERRGANEGLILFNTGDNTFVVAEGSRPMTEWTGDVEAADFNGDGIGDLFIADSGYDAPPFPGFQNSLLLGTERGFIDASSRLPQLEEFSHRSDVVDIDKDGDLDILVTNLGVVEEELSLFLINDGDANFSINRSRLPGSLTNIEGLEVTLTLKMIDLDGDGYEDLVAGKEFDQFVMPPTSTRIFWNDGTGHFRDSEVTTLPDMEFFSPEGGYSVIDIQPIDIESDGDQDIILTAYDPNFRGMALQLYQNLGVRRFTDSSNNCMTGPFQDEDPDIGGPDYLQILDIDNDGQKEVVTHGISIVENPNDIIVMDKLPTGGFTSILSGQLSRDSETQQRLGTTPVKGNGVFGYVEVFVFEGAINLNYVPLEITPASPVINFFDSCTNRISLAIDGNDFGLIEIDFELLQTEPTILLQADQDSARQLNPSIEGLGSIDLSTFALSIPELNVRGVPIARDLTLELREPEALIYELTGFSQ